MHILNPQQLQEVDVLTMQRQQIRSWDLMERAAKAALKQIIADHPAMLGQPISILCGKGNNGGDGLVLARLLLEMGQKPSVWLQHASQYSVDNQENQGLLPIGYLKTFHLHTNFEFPKQGLLIDCLFGYGLNKALTSDWQPIIEQINAFEGRVVSIDMPSGLACEGHIPAGSPIVEADCVYTFQMPKLNLLLPDYGYYAKSIKIISIDLDEAAIAESSSSNFFSDAASMATLRKPRLKYSHKGTFGHALLVGGSYGKMGAIVLASKAAIRTGCGLLTAAVPIAGVSILQCTVPEAMVLADTNEQVLHDFNFPTDYSAIGIGVGMGTSEESQQGFSIFLRSLPANSKLVLDADALNCLAKHPQLLAHLPKESILSPHPKELSRILGTWQHDYDKITKAKAFCQQYDVYLLIKGANSLLVCPDGELHFNASGNPGMATGGAGDVLTGILTSLRAQGYPAKEAALLGMYIHGLAADLAVEELGEESLIASDISNYIGKAFKSIIKGGS